MIKSSQEYYNKKKNSNFNISFSKKIRLKRIIISTSKTPRVSFLRHIPTTISFSQEETFNHIQSISIDALNSPQVIC